MLLLDHDITASGSILYIASFFFGVLATIIPGWVIVKVALAKLETKMEMIEKNMDSLCHDLKDMRKDVEDKINDLSKRVDNLLKR